MTQEKYRKYIRLLSKDSGDWVVASRKTNGSLNNDSSSKLEQRICKIHQTQTSYVKRNGRECTPAQKHQRIKMFSVYGLEIGKVN